MMKRPVWIGCLLIAFLCSVMLFHVTDDMEFCGLQVKSSDRLAEMTADMQLVNKPVNLNELIELDGQCIPYDRESNTFYISQSMEAAEYDGTFRAVGDNCEIYIERDEMLDDKQTAISQGYEFKLWFLTEDRYTTANLIYSGLPVISIGTDQDSMNASYMNGNIVVHNPDDKDIHGMSVKESAITVKRNENTGTITFKLYKKKYDEERDLSLLGLGKRTSWKLYPVSDKDDTFVRTILASYAWNVVCEDENLQRSMELAEVIVDGKYAGLHYLAPKVGKGFMNLEEADRVYECEDILENGTQVYKVVGDEDIPENRVELEKYQTMLASFTEEDLSRIDRYNYINYYIYLQSVCAVQNNREEYYVIVRDRGNSCLYQRCPEKSDYVWGLYPSKIGWQSLTATENIMEDAVYDLIAGQDASIAVESASRWNVLRETVLSTTVLSQVAYTYEKKLADSGYIAREADTATYNEACNDLQGMIVERMDYLDSFFDGVN